MGHEPQRGTGLVCSGKPGGSRISTCPVTLRITHTQPSPQLLPYMCLLTVSHTEASLQGIITQPHKITAVQFKTALVPPLLLCSPAAPQEHQHGVTAILDAISGQCHGHCGSSHTCTAAPEPSNAIPHFPGPELPRSPPPCSDSTRPQCRLQIKRHGLSWTPTHTMSRGRSGWLHFPLHAYTCPQLSNSLQT